MREAMDEKAGRTVLPVSELAADENFGFSRDSGSQMGATHYSEFGGSHGMQPLRLDGSTDEPPPPVPPSPAPPPLLTPAEAARAAVETWRLEQQRLRIKAAEKKRALSLASASKADVMRRMRGTAGASTLDGPPSPPRVGEASSNRDEGLAGACNTSQVPKTAVRDADAKKAPTTGGAATTAEATTAGEPRAEVMAATGGQRLDGLSSFVESEAAEPYDALDVLLLLAGPLFAAALCVTVRRCTDARRRGTSRLAGEGAVILKHRVVTAISVPRNARTSVFTPV